MDKKQIRILFMGTPEIAVSMLERLWSDGYEIIGVVSQPDKKVKKAGAADAAGKAGSFGT